MIKLLTGLLFAALTLGQNPGPSRGGALAAPITTTIAYTGVECDNFTSSGASIACTLTVPGTGVQTLVIYTVVNVGTFTSTTSTCGTVHTIRSVNWNSVIPQTAYALAIYSATSGSCTITTTNTGSNFTAIMATDFSGANATAPIDNASCTSTPFCSGVGIGTAMTNGTITTAGPGEMVIGMGENFSTGTIPATVSGFTQINSVTASSFYAMNYAPASGSYTPSFVGQGADWVAMAIALTT